MPPTACHLPQPQQPSTFQHVQMFQLMAFASGILRDFADQLAPVNDVVAWLSTSSFLLERLLFTTAGEACVSAWLVQSIRRCSEQRTTLRRRYGSNVEGWA